MAAKKKPEKAILSEQPKQKHPGNLGKVMRGSFNSKKMSVLRAQQK
jgi:hypothetical protein